MTLRYHEIAEANHRILNPYTDEKLMALGEVCRLTSGQRMLDLACGKGEMLCRWARAYGIEGLGIDLSAVFLAAARARADELGVSGRVRFRQEDAATAALEPGAYDLVACIGATWIGGGLQGTVDLLRPALRPGGLLLAGECYWIDPPPAAAYAALRVGEEDFVTLAGTASRLAASGMELVEMFLADGDTWDRYCAAQWWTLREWLEANPHHPEHAALRVWLEDARRSYLEYSRRYLGWGVFVCRPRPETGGGPGR